MFVMINDGGTLKEGVGGPFAAHQILAQRLFIFDLLASGLALAPLHRADFKDTKVILCLASFSTFQAEHRSRFRSYRSFLNPGFAQAPVGIFPTLFYQRA